MRITLKQWMITVDICQEWDKRPLNCCRIIRHQQFYEREGDTGHSMAYWHDIPRNLPTERTPKPDYLIALAT